ncbi:MAG: hypothetical protein IJF12_02185, partial [Alphaproteobacteria bacterium]|nr:hypothetical protein [Alphaproteobacteria bacterium]
VCSVWSDTSGAVIVSVLETVDSGITAESKSSFHPDTKADLMSLSVPFWREHLIIGAKAFEMTGLGYLGADIVLDKNKGPMMLELNARPGLAIQIANGKGLLNAVKDIEENYPKNLGAEERVDFILNK